VPEQDNPPTRRSYSDAEAAADLATYHALKRSVSVRSLLVVAFICLVFVRWLPHPVLALAAGGLCGVLNTLLTMRSGERLVETRSVGGFVLSSFLRIGLFGIVPVAFAMLGPWWSMAWYFAGFFLPLAMFAYGARRAFASK
jgi:multisubunit Na+/H+ antiporter MnhB subunit